MGAANLFILSAARYIEFNFYIINVICVHIERQGEASRSYYVDNN